MPKNQARADLSLSGRGIAATGERRWRGDADLKRHRRELILKSVADVLRSSPLSTVTMEEIAGQLGMTKGNLYYYFKDKQDILYHCHMRSVDLSLRALDEAMAQGRTPVESLRILLTGHILGIVNDGFGSVLQTDLEHFRPEHRRRYVAKRDELELGFRGLIEEGNRAGDFDCPNVKIAGFAILGAINWMPKWYRADGALSSRQIAAEMVDYFIRGLAARTTPAERSGRRKGRVSPAGRKSAIVMEG